MRNPLIADTPLETAQNIQEALSALMELMADNHSGLVRLMGPIEHALNWMATQSFKAFGDQDSLG
jgi:hypothetical protein